MRGDVIAKDSREEQRHTAIFAAPDDLRRLTKRISSTPSFPWLSLDLLVSHLPERS